MDQAHIASLELRFGIGGVHVVDEIPDVLFRGFQLIGAAVEGSMARADKRHVAPWDQA